MSAGLAFGHPPLKGGGIACDVVASSPSPLVGEGWGGGSGGLAPKVPRDTTPTPDPSPAETAYTRVSATQLSDRNRQQPISIGGGEKQVAAAQSPLLNSEQRQP